MNTDFSSASLMDVSAIRHELVSMRVMTPIPQVSENSLPQLQQPFRPMSRVSSKLRKVIDESRPSSAFNVSESSRTTTTSLSSTNKSTKKSDIPQQKYFLRPSTAAIEQRRAKSNGPDKSCVLDPVFPCARGNMVYHSQYTGNYWKQCETTHQRDRELGLYNQVVEGSQFMTNILRYYGEQHRYVKSHQKMFAQVPFVEVEPYLGTLEECLLKMNVDIPTRLSWLHALTAQLAEVHKAGVVHTIISPKTIVMTQQSPDSDLSPATLTPKFSDWTCAVVHDADILRRLAKFTLTAQRAEPALPLELLPLQVPDTVVSFGLPPESIKSNLKPHPSYDVYMLGKLFSQVLYGLHELPSKAPKLPDDVSPSTLSWVETRDLIATMVWREPKQRIPLRMALFHPAFWSLEVKVEFVLHCAKYFQRKFDHSVKLSDWIAQPNSWQNLTRDWFHALADENAPTTRYFYDFTWGALIELFHDLSRHIEEHSTYTICQGQVRKFQETFLCVRFPFTVLTLFKWFLSHPVDGTAFHQYLVQMNCHPSIEGLLRPTPGGASSIPQAGILLSQSMSF